MIIWLDWSYAKELCVKSINELTELLPALVVFVQVVNSGNFSAAGRALSMPPSTVSRMIDRLEKRLHLLLFTRTTRTLVITEAGEAIYQQAMGVITATHSLFSHADSYSDQPTGLLRITAPNTLGKILLTPFLPTFLRHYTEINVELHLTDRVVNIVQESYDLALRVTDTPPDNMVARALVPIDYVLVCSQEYGEPLPERPIHLHQHNLFFPSEPQFRGEWRFWHHDTVAPVQLVPRLVINTSDAMIDAILQGVGIGLLPTFITNDYLPSGRLRRVLPEWRLENPRLMTAYAITLPSRLLPMKTRVFVDDFITWLGSKKEIALPPRE
jgi:DNA-binding transcriptional LysR family regulator